MKCQHCSRMATLHVTEVPSDDVCEVLHFCEDCGRKYLQQPLVVSTPAAPAEKTPTPTPEPATLEAHPEPCDVCGLQFVEFRNSGRLGCENDYEAFQQELIPLLENIHGDTRHAGKIPRRRGISQKDLVTLRKRLQQAIQVEDYEAAAQLRDLIKRAEEGQA